MLLPFADAESLDEELPRADPSWATWPRCGACGEPWAQGENGEAMPCACAGACDARAAEGIREEYFARTGVQLPPPQRRAVILLDEDK